MPGEIDLPALDAVNRELVHVECSSEALSCPVRVNRLRTKFGDASAPYETLAGLHPTSVTQIAFVGFSPAPQDLGEGIIHKPVSTLVQEIYAELASTAPVREAVAESMRLLWAVQYAACFRPVLLILLWLPP